MDPADPARPATSQHPQPLLPLDYGRPAARPVISPDTALNGFAGGVFLGSAAGLLADEMLHGGDFDPPAGAVCVVIGFPLVVAAVATVAMGILIVVRRWWFANRCRTRGGGAGFAAGVLAAILVVGVGRELDRVGGAWPGLGRWYLLCSGAAALVLTAWWLVRPSAEPAADNQPLQRTGGSVP